MICHELTYGLEPCERPATTVVEHADGEHLTYCTAHAEGCWSHRPQRPLPAEHVTPEEER